MNLILSLQFFFKNAEKAGINIFCKKLKSIKSSQLFKSIYILNQIDRAAKTYLNIVRTKFFEMGPLTLFLPAKRDILDTLGEIYSHISAISLPLGNLEFYTKTFTKLKL